MRQGQTVLLTCQISRSAFSGERVVRVCLMSGAEYIGVVPVDYCLNRDKTSLKPDQPPQGKKIQGFVEGRVIDNGGAEARVAIPDGEVISVSSSAKQIPYKKEADKASYVPLGS